MPQPRQSLASQLRCLPTVGCACCSFLSCCSWNINKRTRGTMRAPAAAASTILIYYFDSCYFSTCPGVAACFTQCVIVLVRHTLSPSPSLFLYFSLCVACFIFIHTLFWFYCSNYFMLYSTPSRFNISLPVFRFIPSSSPAQIVRKH